MLVTLEMFQLPRLRLNTVASANMDDISVTLPTSQPLISALKREAPSNIRVISSTPPTSQLLMLRLNAVAPENMAVISFTLDKRPPQLLNSVLKAVAFKNIR